MEDSLMKVAVYTRVSTQEQATEGTSLSYQREQLEKECRSKGWHIAGIYEDAGFSGKDGERPALKRLLNDARLGLFNKALIFKMDRLARSLKLLLDIEEKLSELGISFYSVGEVLDSSTTSGRHFIQILAMVSEWEREAITERTRSGKLQRYKEGKWAGGNPAYGFDYCRETKKLVINEAEAAVVRRIFKSYASGKTLSTIADTLNAEHISPRGKNGKGWRPTGVRDILLSTSYIGSLIVHNPDRPVNAPNIGQNQTIEIAVPPIITDKKEWGIAQ